MVGDVKNVVYVAKTGVVRVAGEIAPPSLSVG